MSDGSRSYQAAIAQYLPDTRHVLDRFHMVPNLLRAWMSAGDDRVGVRRVGESK